MSSAFNTNATQPEKASLIDNLAKKICFKKLEQLSKGSLVMQLDDKRLSFGNKSDTLKAEIYIPDRRTFTQLIFGGSIGAAEAYIYGYWEADNLSNVVEIFAANLEVLDNFDTSINIVNRFLSKIYHFNNRNDKTQAKKNISAHYDLSNDFFKAFLDSTMMYSSGIFENTHDTLHQASLNKLKRICETLNLSEKDHLVEIGSGWGGMAIYAAKHYGCRVTSTTISKAQYKYCLDIVKKEQLEDKVTFLLEDYRNLSGKYNKLVSIEMIEAVGSEFLPIYFSKCSELLNEEGLMLLQAITITDQRYDFYKKEPDFINQYIFPGGHLPSNHEIQKNTMKHTDLQLIDLKDIGFDYAKTLHHWADNFNNSREKILSLGFDEQFIRTWQYYFSYCKGAFLQNNISTSQFLLSKRQGKAHSFIA